MAAESSAAPLARRLAELLQVSEKRVMEAFDKPKNLLKKNLRMIVLVKNCFACIDAGCQGRTGRCRASDAALWRKIDSARACASMGAIALPTSQKLQTEAYSYWKLAEGANLTHEGFQWRVRIALREGDWKMVKSGIQAMPATLRSMPSWTYWYGRALQQEGRTEEAQAIYVSLSDQNAFYGQLALEERGQKIGVPATAKPVTPEEVNYVAQNPNLQRALKFYNMNLRFEGTREWNWALRSMNEREIPCGGRISATKRYAG